MKPARGFILPLVIILIASLAILGGIAAWKFKPNKAISSGFKTKTECEAKSGRGCQCMYTLPDTAQTDPECTGWEPINTTSKISDPTANWKTYNATDFIPTQDVVKSQNRSLYNFSIKYPPDWKSKAFLYFMSPDYQAPMTAQETVFKGAFIQVQASQAYTDSFSTLMDWFNNSFKDPRSSGPPPDNPKLITLNIDALGKVDGLQYDQKVSIQAPNSVFKYSADLTGTSLTKLFVHNNVMYHFILTSKDDPIKYMPILDEMISTFKFTSDETANWKTYNSSDNAYSFKYPINWDILSVGKNDLMVAPKEKVDSVRNSSGFNGGKFLTILVHELDKPYPSDEFKSDQTKQVSEENITVGSIQAKKYSSKYMESPGEGVNKGDIITNVVLENKGKLFSIQLVDDSQKETFDQILSTFKFTN